MNAHFRKPALPVILLASTVLFTGCATQGKLRLPLKSGVLNPC